MMMMIMLIKMMHLFLQLQHSWFCTCSLHTKAVVLAGCRYESGFLSNTYLFAIDSVPESSHTGNILSHCKRACNVKTIPKSKKKTFQLDFSQNLWHQLYTLQIRQSQNALQPAMTNILPRVRLFIHIPHQPMRVPAFINTNIGCPWT